METTRGTKRRRLNELASEVARHHQVRKPRQFSFDSRRLHQLLFGNQPIEGRFPAASSFSTTRMMVVVSDFTRTVKQARGG